MRKSTLLAIIFLLGITNCYSQDKGFYINDSVKISRLKKDVIKLNNGEMSNSETRFPFASFIVNDVRPDTTYIGVKCSGSNLDFPGSLKKLQLENTASISLSNFFNAAPTDRFAPSSSNLICYIKQFRLAQLDSTTKVDGPRKFFNRLNFEVEAFLNINGSLYPALRYDTTAFEVVENNRRVEILNNILEDFLRKASLIDTSRIIKRKPYSTADVEARYLQRFNKPILTSAYKAGVYKTFEEFIRNNPSMPDYQFKKDAKATILYTKNESGEWLPTRGVFGFCDGTTAWINLNNIFHPLIKRGNTFEFIADANQQRKRKGKSNIYILQSGIGVSVASTLLANMASNGLEKYYAGKSLYQLNLDNGEW